MFCPECKSEYREGFSRCAKCDIDLISELPPETSVEYSVEYIDLVTIETYSTRYEAELANGLLEESGIDATVSGDDYGGIHPGLSYSRGVRLLVKKEDVENAKKIISNAANPAEGSI